MKKVLVTYGWVRSSYAAVRNLAQHGLEVVVADTNRIGMCQWSKYPIGKYRYTSHYEDEQQFIADINKICREQDIGLILASHNETEILARYRNQLPEGVGTLLPDPGLCELFNNKARGFDHAKASGVPVPQRIEYTDPAMLDAALRAAGVKSAVIKLLSGNSAKGVFYADEPEAVQALVNKLIRDFNLTPERLPQVEERVEGDGWGCSCLFWHGQPIATFCHRRLREKTVTGGTSTYREASWNPEMVAHTHKLLGDAGWHGLAMVEYKVHPETGEIWFIEVNPRLWGSLHLAIASGYEFPYLAWLCATEGPEAAMAYHAKREKFPNTKARWLLGDVIVSLSQLKNGKPGEAFRTLFRQPADSFDDWNVQDPMAFAGELLYYGTTFLRKRSANPVEKGMIG